MTRPLILRPAAWDDVRSSFASLTEIESSLGTQFLARLRETLGRVEAAPEIYGTVWQDVRAARLRQFRYIVYYVLFEDRVEVLAVLHGSRDPQAWTGRL